MSTCKYSLKFKTTSIVATSTNLANYKNIRRILLVSVSAQFGQLIVTCETNSASFCNCYPSPPVEEKSCMSTKKCEWQNHLPSAWKEALLSEIRDLDPLVPSPSSRPTHKCNMCLLLLRISRTGSRSPFCAYQYFLSENSQILIS